MTQGCPQPECYRFCGNSTLDEFPTDVPGTKGNLKLVRHISFVDCPGYDILMATMLNSAAEMGTALSVLAGNLVLSFRLRNTWLL